jgi:hypothetical protein
MEIPKKLKDEIWEYCRLNDISNIDEFILKMVRQGYTIEKYGSTPLGSGEIKEVEKVVEKIVEVPVEKIIEKEIIKEVPVEKIVTVEVPVEKIVTITNNEELESKIFQLNKELEGERQNFSTIVEDLENNFHNEMSNRDEKIDELRHLLDKDERDEKIESLTQLIESERTEKQNILSEMSKKQLEYDKIKEELDILKKKTDNNDIYGEEKKGGWFGSNLLNRR